MKICPNCKTKMSDSYTHCSVCGCDLSAAYIVDSATYNKSVEQGRNQRVVVTLVTAIVVIAAIVAACVAFYYINNKNAEQIYKEAYSALHDTDLTYISSSTKSLVEKASKKASSPFIDKNTRKKIEDLEKVAKEYTLLGEVENKLASGNLSRVTVTELSDKFESISTNEVKRSDRYKNVKPYIQSTKFKYENKAWAESALEELKKDSDTISVWSRNNGIAYYTGAVYFAEDNGNGMTVILEDYNGGTYTLVMEYNYYNSSGTWNSSIDKLKEKLKINTPCVMAAVVAEGYSSDKIFLYKYITK